MSLLGDFALSRASMTGREHLRLHRNNQDAVAVRASDEVIAGAVCDGCGEGRSSESGARLFASFVTDHLFRTAAKHGSAESMAHALTSALVHWLWQLTDPFADRAHRAAFIRDHLLTTLLACVVLPQRTVIFGVGDGVYSVNGAATRLEPGADNAPAYLAYRVVEPDLMLAHVHPEVRVHHDGPTGEVQTLLLGTDGLEGISLAEWERDARYAKNPTLLQRRFVVLGERERAFGDDATALLLQRRRAV